MENIENYYGRLLPEGQCPKAVSVWACSLQSMVAKKEHYTANAVAA